MRAHRQSGFTLLEIMLVIFLMGLIFGIGAGMFAHLDMSDKVARPLVENVLRSAQNWAKGGAAATVRIDPATGKLVAEGMRVVGTWHFEALPIDGAFGLEGVQSGGELVDDGFQGKALSFAGQGANSSIDIAVQRDPAFDLTGGFDLRCALRIQPDCAAAVLTIGNVVGLEVADGEVLSAWFVATRLDDDKQPMRGGRIALRSGGHVLVPGRWAQVELRYDRRALELFVDGARVAGRDEEARVWRLEGSLVLSPGQTAFQGAIDSLVVSAVGASDESELPRNAHFAANVPREIVFQPGGGLDRARHKESVRVTLEYENGNKGVITVQPYGTVD